MAKRRAIASEKDASSESERNHNASEVSASDMDYEQVSEEASEPLSRPRRKLDFACVSALEVFQGTDAEDILDWIQRFEELVDTELPVADIRRLALSRVKGAALDDFRAVATQALSWSEFRAGLLERFNDERVRLRRVYGLMTRTQRTDEPTASFVRNLRVGLRKVGLQKFADDRSPEATLMVFMLAAQRMRPERRDVCLRHILRPESEILRELAMVEGAETDRVTRDFLSCRQ